MKDEWEKLVKARKTVGKPCDVCKRKAGYAPLNRFGERDLNPETPLGPIKECPDCGLNACPDCLHERECCESAGIIPKNP